ncbi:MAG TPA: PilZ domain-containing protein [Nitrospirota bacterium]|nr:PilZ domain-containing protein [Nitrospirota bacterium]
MTIYGPNRRAWNRPTREFQVTINDSNHQVYTFDFSPKGLRLGGAALNLHLGERVNITTKKGDKIYNFTGEVKRIDGLLPIKRIGRSVNGFFVMASGSAYQEFFAQL